MIHSPIIGDDFDKIKSKKCNCSCHKFLGLAKKAIAENEAIYDIDIDKEYFLAHKEKCCDGIGIEQAFVKEYYIVAKKI